MPRFKIKFTHIDPHGNTENKAKEFEADTPEQARSAFARKFRQDHPTPHKHIILTTKLVRELRVD